MMADKEYSRYQQKVIQRYYDNREQIDEQRLAELVTSLFLASPAKQKKLWQTAEELLTRMKVPASRIEHIISLVTRLCWHGLLRMFRREF